MPARSTWRFALILGAAMSLTVAAACDGYGDNGDATATPGATSTVAGAPTPAPTGDASGESLDLPNESGEEPIFWRTSDEFASVQAGEAYKVVLRVTNGYAEESLPLTATRGGASVDFEAMRATPAGADDEGTYYVVSLVFPQEGSWQLTAAAGPDDATVTVDVAPGGAATG
jgi:hypothetical protein